MKPNMSAATRCRRLAILSAALLSTACSVIIVEPRDQAVAAPSSVVSEVTLPGMYKPNTFSARLNERDVTSQYTVASGKATGTLTGLTARPEPYVLDVGACWGLNILFVTQPVLDMLDGLPWPVNGCPSARASFSIVQPRLTLTLTPASVTAPDAVQASVQVTPVSASPVTVTLSSSNAAVASIQPPPTFTIPANTASASRTVASPGAGTATITVSATSYTDGTGTVTVKPRLTQLAPLSAPTGATLTATGAGFVAPLTVYFEGTTAPATNTTAPATNISATQFNVVVPTSLEAGVAYVTVLSNGQTSSPPLKLTVLCPGPVLGPKTLFSFCEFCPLRPPYSSATWREVEACTLGEATAMLGYPPDPPPGTCWLNQIARANCTR